MRRVIETVETLSRLMEEERRALLAADTAAFDRLARRKDAALTGLTAALEEAPEALHGEHATPEGEALAAALKGLRGKAGRSHDLLGAALAGLRDARALLDAAREMRHDTYTADGGKERHGAPAARLERRA